MNGLRISKCMMAFVGLAIAGLYSCSEDSVAPRDGEKLTQAELEVILNSDDISGIADDAIADLFNDSSSAKMPTAKLNDCYVAEYLENGFVATFNNCTLNGRDNINGTVAVSYSSTEGAATFTATFDGFQAGDITISGTREYILSQGSDATSGSFTVNSDMTMVWADGRTISESGTKTLTIQYDQATESLSLTVSGAWTVTTDEHTYSVETLGDLMADSSCEFLTSGKLNVSKSGLEVIVDFGDGSCDNKVTVTYPDGATEEISM